MEITKITYKPRNSVTQELVSCDIVLDNEIRLVGVRLYKTAQRGYYLIFPSKQDIYQEVNSLNQGLDIEYPKYCGSSNKKKEFDEFFYPVNRNFYEYLLKAVIEGFENLRN